MKISKALVGVSITALAAGLFLISGQTKSQPFSPCPIASTAVIGCVKPDGTSIVISGGVISATGAGGSVSSFNTRTGAVVPQAGDYNSIVETLTGKTISGGSNTITNIGNASLTNSSMTLAGHSVSLGGTQTFSASDLTNGVSGSGAICLASGSACSGGGSLTVTDGTNTVTSTTTITTGVGLVVGGSAGSATVTPSTPTSTKSADYTVAAADMAGTINLTGTHTLTIPAISSTILAANMSVCFSNIGTGTWTISTTPTINGTTGTSIVPGAGGCLVSNGTSLDYQSGMQLPSGTRLGGVLTTALASHNFATAISTSTGALTGAQPGALDLSATGTPSSTTFLRGDNTWATPAGSGTVTTITAGSGITLSSGATCTSTCTISSSGGGGGVAAAPQGRLTCTTATPVMSADVASCTTIYYDTYQGNLYPNWSGSAMANVTITSDEISMGLDAVTPHIASGSVYDIYGTAAAAICAGPAWSSTTARGTGAGTTELQLKSGVWSNKNSLTHCWGGASGTTDLGAIAANQGTYLGTVYASANGTTKMMFHPAAAAGTNNIIGLYNAYNRVNFSANVQDNSAAWTYASNAWRATDSLTTNRLTWVDGLKQSAIDTTSGIYAISGQTVTGITLDGTGAPNAEALNIFANDVTLVANDSFAPQLGLHFVQMVEMCNSSTCSWAGAPTSGVNSTAQMVVRGSY